MTEHLDVLVVGAGLSGIGTAAQLRKQHPHRSLAVLEMRDVSGGTWDLFRYPGVRSDSDMFTLGYRWRPWRGEKALADGPSILQYVRDVAREYGVDELIRYRQRVVRADWDSATARWTVQVETPDGPHEISAGFLLGCTGYYDYEGGYAPVFPGQDEFAGQVVHPQQWPEDLDYTGKKVVVIGSGATAVTLVPAMAPDAEHVTMLQRSPTYILSAPGRDPIARRLQRLPERIAYPIVRWKSILIALASYQLSRKRPDVLRSFIRKNTIKALPPEIDVDQHFKPTYDPWDQRLCLVPDGDLFQALRRGTASIVTDTIETFTETGIRLTSGEEIEADLVVTATGLKILPFGGITLGVDGQDVKVHDTMAYKALMLSGVPNFAYTIGYTNASWTLKADLVTEYVVRLLRHMDEHGHRQVVAERDPAVGERPFMDFSSGYVLRALDEVPVQGDRAPWLLKQNYVSDVRTIRRDDIEDGVLRFA
ncbi:flavin-containing monooxygenase [Nocardioides sp. URHA0020]|uniref:flavin-containing monooxygenase n=1 Tax=Nocardioides sp. URHA0020 TaxID=1380392 RepID=UPI00048F103A|nr:NAD(P)/FAD-dependent oxidoreductase [Nocardioides sp. URHA0020]